MSVSSEASIHRAVVTPSAAGARLDLFLKEACPALSRMRLKGLIQDGRVQLGGETIREPSHRVKPGQEVVLEVPPALPAAPEPQAMPLVVVFEDEHLIVIDKPAGLVVHPAPGNPDRTLVNALLAHLDGRLAGIGGVKRPGIVHRLDKDTSGLLVAAKTDAAHAHLAAAFAAHDIDRAYKALVRGRPRPPKGEIDGAIGRSPRNRKKMAVLTRGGKPALTRYAMLRGWDEAASLLECRLATGRTHQIRVHLAHIGHPVLGDPVYGRAGQARRAGLGAAAETALAALGRQALHAFRLGFRHPASGQRLRFESELPQDFKTLIDALDAG